LEPSLTQQAMMIVTVTDIMAIEPIGLIGIIIAAN